MEDDSDQQDAIVQGMGQGFAFSSASASGSGASESKGGEASKGVDGNGEEEEEVIPDAKNVFITRDELAKTEQDTADLVFRVITNDGQEQTSVWLTGAKNIFSQQLPKMPPEYIARLVFDPRHRTMVALKHGRVVGGICYRPFFPQRFAEIAFLAITSSQQVRGYGTRLMNNLKEAVKNVGITEFLTYADNYATGYFRKQGFTDSISMDPRRWKGYIKEYEGGTLMQCTIHRNVQYNDVAKMLRAQRDFILRSIRARGVDLKAAGVEVREGRLMTRLGSLQELRAKALKAEREQAEAAAQAAMEDDEDEGLAEGGSGGGAGGAAGAGAGSSSAGPKRRRRSSVASPGGAAARGPTRRQRDQAAAALRGTLARLLDAIKADEHSWPFLDPVDPEEAEDYYEKIKEPMDLKTMDSKVKEGKYGSIDAFLADVKLICQNCRTYNPPDSSYVQAANRLEAFAGARYRTLVQQKQVGIPVV